MSRVWIYDRSKSDEFAEKVRKAKSKGRRPPGRWQVGYYDKAGKQRLEIHQNKTTAEDRRSELEAKLKAGTFVDPSAGKIRLEEIGEKWIETRNDLKPTTWWKYRALLDNHVLPEWKSHRIDHILGEDVSVWVAMLMKDKNKGGSGLGASQTRQAYRVLSMILGWCVPSRLPTNPAVGVKLPIPLETEHIYLTYEQVETLANASGSLRTKYDRPTASASVNRTLVLLLAYTGLRWGEAAALRTHRVDLERRRLRVASSLYEINGVQGEGLPKTGKPRSVPIPASLVPELETVLDGKKKNDLLFTTARGNSLRAHNWRMREFNSAVAASGIEEEGLTPHKLRHTAASLAIAAGADVKVLQQMLGHADGAMTLNIYGHLFPDRLDEVAAAVDSKRATTLAQIGATA